MPDRSSLCHLRRSTQSALRWTGSWRLWAPRCVPIRSRRAVAEAAKRDLCRRLGSTCSRYLLAEAQRRGADVIATVCPLCQFNLEVFQNEVGSRQERRFRCPSFTSPSCWPRSGRSGQRHRLQCSAVPVEPMLGRKRSPVPEMATTPLRFRRDAARIGVYICHCGTNIAAHGRREGSCTEYAASSARRGRGSRVQVHVLGPGPGH